MFTRLYQSGWIVPNAEEIVDEIPKQLRRRARLVYVGNFLSADGPVTVTEEKLTRLMEKHNGRWAKFRRMLSGEVCVGACPPMQVDHALSAMATIGRVTGSLSVEDFVDETDGVTKKGLFADVLFLGRENVEKVLDGRWAQLSIGADFDLGEMSELSITPFPAAENATVLSRKRLARECITTSNQGKREYEVYYDPANGQFEALVDGKSIGWYQSEGAARQAAVAECEKEFNPTTTSLKNGDRPMYRLMEKRIRSYLRLKKKMSDEEVDKEMKKLSDDENEENLKKLADEVDKDEEDEKKEKEEKLTAFRGKVTNLSTDFRKKVDNTRLMAAKAGIWHRLSSFRALGKITPAEIKKMNIDELAAKSDDVITEVMKTYEDRQPVVMVGQISSVKALTHADIIELAKKTQRLTTSKGMVINNAQELRTAFNMKHIDEAEYKRLSAKLEGAGDGGSDAINIHVDSNPVQDMAAMEADYQGLCQLMDGGKLAEAKDGLKKLMENMKKRGAYGMSDATNHDASAAQLTAMQNEIAELKGQFEEAMRLVDSLASGL